MPTDLEIPTQDELRTLRTRPATSGSKPSA